jgi:hypothetical protein
MVLGHTEFTASGSPVNPSQTKMHTSLVPPVLDLGQHVRQVLGSLAALAHPQAQNVRLPIDVNPGGHVDGPVGHVALSDLDVDGVHQHDRIDRIDRPVLPFGHGLGHPVGDPGDGLLGQLCTVDLTRVGVDLPVPQALRRHRRDHLVCAQPRRRLGTITGSNVPTRSRGTSTLIGPIPVITAMEPLPLRLLPE